MNKQEAYELAKKAELKSALNFIGNAAKDGEYNRSLIISNREVIDELNKLGFNCGLINEETNVWNIDWSK